MAERLTANERATQPAYRYRTRLEGTQLAYRHTFNTRGQYWTLGIATVGGDQIVEGMAMRVGEVLNARFVDPRLPPGELRLEDTSRQGIDPGRDDLGARVRLTYTPLAEVVA